MSAASLASTIEAIVRVAAANRRLNEADTRAGLIDPMLDALGWNPRDLAVVKREVPVPGGTTVDYALIGADGKPRLHVEAKALGSRLDLKVVTQTVNYANGAGVPWCVLTDGIHWRVFWSNAPVANDRKGVFDVDLSAVTDEATTTAERAEMLGQLDLLSRARVEGGDLDQRGRSLFDNAAVSAVLDQLFTHPPDELVDLVSARLDHPPDDDRVREAIARLGRPFTDSPGLDRPAAAVPLVKAPGSRKQGPRQAHTYEEHFGNASAAVVDLYQRFHEAVMAKDPRMTRTFKAKAVNYALGPGKRDIVVTVVPQAARLKLFLVLPGDRAEGTDDLRNMKPDGPDTPGIGHHGWGDVQAPLTADNLDDRLALVDEAIAAHDAPG